jgi:hypothetical protein
MPASPEIMTGTRWGRHETGIDFDIVVALRIGLFPVYGIWGF